MNDRQLRYILTIAEEGNITTAAQKLYISQPSLSSLLATVEKELETRLFDRTSSRVSPTYAGERYIDAARRILRIKRELELEIDDIRDDRRGRLSVGCGRQFSTFLFPIVIPAFKQQNPQIMLKLHEERLPTLYSMLCAGELDIMFTYAEHTDDSLQRVPIYGEEIVLLAPPGFAPRHAQRREGHGFPVLDLREVRDQPFILLKPGNHLRDISDKIFRDAGIQPQVALETNIWQTCTGMVESGEAFSILPYSRLTDREPLSRLNLFSLEGDYFRHIALYHQKIARLPSVIDRFIALTQATVGGIIG